MGLETAGAKISSGSLKFIGAWIKWGMIMFFLAILLINAISISMREGSVAPGLKDLGGRFFFPTLKLSEESRKITENEGVYVKDEDNFWKGIWNFIVTYTLLIASLFIVYYWLKLLTWLWAHSPLSDTSHAFVNVVLGALTFFILQSFFLLIFAESSLSKLELFLVPYKCFLDFIKAIPYIVEPFTGIADTFVGGSGNKTNLTV